VAVGGWAWQIAFTSGRNVVKEEVHGQLRREFALAGKLPPVQIGNTNLPAPAAFIHAGWRGQNALVVQAYRHISFAGYVVALLVHPAPAIQISRRCCSSVLALPAKVSPVDIGGHLPGLEVSLQAVGDNFSCVQTAFKAVHRGTLSVNAAHLERAGYAIDGQHVYAAIRLLTLCVSA